MNLQSAKALFAKEFPDASGFLQSRNDTPGKQQALILWLGFKKALILTNQFEEEPVVKCRIREEGED